MGYLAERAARVAVAIGALVLIGCHDAAPRDGFATAPALAMEGAARLRIDQSNGADPAPLWTTAIGGASDQRLLQAFTTGSADALRAIAVPVGCAAGAFLTLEVYRANDDGLPVGSAIAATTRPASFFPSTVGAGTPFTRIPIAEPNVLARRRYAFVLSASGNSCAIVPALAGETYPRGDLFFDARPNPVGWILNKTSGPSTPWDLPFQTYLQVP